MTLYVPSGRTQVINLDSDDDDVVEMFGRNDIRILDGPPGLTFQIKRTPKTLERARFFQGGIGNVSKKEMKAVADEISNFVPPFCPIPLSVPLSVTIRVYLKRPNDNFTNNVRGAGRLKKVAVNYIL